MRRRGSNSNNAAGTRSDESDEESLPTADPEDEELGFQETAKLANKHILHLEILDQLKQGKKWWAQCLTIYFAAVLTYSYHNVGSSVNVQIAIMAVITLVGATPFASSHLIPTSIGAFVGVLCLLFL